MTDVLREVGPEARIDPWNPDHPWPAAEVA